MISTLKGNISLLDFDLIVDPTNQQVLPMQGVSTQIFHQAGSEMMKACQALNGLEVGKAKMTESFNLPCKAVIHTCGPRYIDGAHNEDEYLAACYWNSMALAYDYMRKNDMESINIAFPCISTGINAYPNHEACVIAIQTVKRLMNKFPETRAIHVCFVCDKTEDYMLYKEALRLR